MCSVTGLTGLLGILRLAGSKIRNPAPTTFNRRLDSTAPGHKIAAAAAVDISTRAPLASAHRTRRSLGNESIKQVPRDNLDSVRDVNNKILAHTAESVELQCSCNSQVVGRNRRIGITSNTAAESATFGSSTHTFSCLAGGFAETDWSYHWRSMCVTAWPMGYASQRCHKKSPTVLMMRQYSPCAIEMQLV